MSYSGKKQLVAMSLLLGIILGVVLCAASGEEASSVALSPVQSVPENTQNDGSVTHEVRSEAISERVEVTSRILQVRVVCAESGNPVSHAHVYWVGRVIGETDTEGVIFTSIVDVARNDPKSSWVGVVAEGYEPAVAQVDGQAISIALAPGHTLKGRVVDPDGQPVSQATVAIVSGGLAAAGQNPVSGGVQPCVQISGEGKLAFRALAISGDNGEFEFAGCPDRVLVSCSRSGYVSQNIRVQGNSATAIDVRFASREHYCDLLLAPVYVSAVGVILEGDCPKSLAKNMFSMSRGFPREMRALTYQQELAVEGCAEYALVNQSVKDAGFDISSITLRVASGRGVAFNGVHGGKVRLLGLDGKNACDPSVAWFVRLADWSENDVLLLTAAVPAVSYGQVEIASHRDLAVESIQKSAGIPFRCVEKCVGGMIKSYFPVGDYVAYPVSLVGPIDEARVSFTIHEGQTTSVKYRDVSIQDTVMRVYHAGDELTSAYSLSIEHDGGSAMITPNSEGVYSVCFARGRYRVYLYSESLDTALSQVIAIPVDGAEIDLHVR